MLDMNKIKKDFPILRVKINGKRLVYLDNAATSQKPKQVIQKLVEYYECFNANIHRSIHTLGEMATEEFEKARKEVAKFINAKEEEIIFVKNCTEGLNLAAYTLAREIKSGNIVTSIMEHHSNFVPWQQLCIRKRMEFRVADINEDFTLNYEDLYSKINKRTRVIALTHVSNILGSINDIGKVAKEGGDAYFVVDAAQSAPHLKINVKKLDVDFLAFSAHKMFGPTGVGVLYVRKDVAERLNPFLYGGEMIKEVYITKTKWNKLPYKYEAGTPNIADVVAFGEAIRYLRRVGMNKVRAHDKKISKLALRELKNIRGLKLYGPTKVKDRIAIFSFNIKGIHSHDVAHILDSEGIAVRSGHGCAMPLMRRLGVNSVARASFYIYNDEKDLEALIKGIEKVKRVFKVD